MQSKGFLIGGVRNYLLLYIIYIYVYNYLMHQKWLMYVHTSWHFKTKKEKCFIHIDFYSLHFFYLEMAKQLSTAQRSQSQKNYIEDNLTT